MGRDVAGGGVGRSGNKSDLGRTHERGVAHVMSPHSEALVAHVREILGLKFVGGVADL
jgi:hypothetical protein